MAGIRVFFAPEIRSAGGTIYRSNLQFNNMHTKYDSNKDRNSGSVIDNHNCNNMLYDVTCQTTNGVTTCSSYEGTSLWNNNSDDNNYGISFLFDQVSRS